MLSSILGLALKWKPQVLLAGGATALALVFGAGWQTATWKADAGYAAERIAEATERAAQAQERADELELRDKANNAQAARLVALRRDYTEVMETINALPDDGSCGLPADFVRAINQLR